MSEKKKKEEWVEGTPLISKLKRANKRERDRTESYTISNSEGKNAQLARVIQYYSFS